MMVVVVVVAVIADIYWAPHVAQFGIVSKLHISLFM